jgi:hypothetical protein
MAVSDGEMSGGSDGDMRGAELSGGSRGQVAASSRPGLSRRQLRTLRGSTFGLLVMLIIQFGLGIAVNLYVTLPASDTGSGIFGAVGKALSSSSASLAAHAGFGLLIILAALALIVRAIIFRHAPSIVLSILGLLSTLAAAFNGARFVSDGGTNNASLSMALAAGGAMLWYAILLFVLASTGAQPD